MRKPTGQIIERKLKQGRTFAIRFRAYGGRYLETLGTMSEGWNRARAEEALANRLADVRRGIWQPPQPDPEPETPRPDPTFHEFSSEWLEAKRPELRERTVDSYRWQLTHHLLPFFQSHRLSKITVETVDRYKTFKLREGTLGPNQINKTLARLAQILEVAVEYGYIERNPAKGKRRRVKGSAPQRSWVEPEQLPALLAAADSTHRPLIATLAGAGLRVGEACALDWRDVNLGTGTIVVRESKTEAGAGRRVDLPVGLLQELSELKARSPATKPGAPVFLTRGAKRQTPSNVERRLKTTIRRANKELAKLDVEPISARVTPHSLRRTYTSLRAALGDDLVYIAQQAGHAKIEVTYGIYQKAVRRRERLSGEYRGAFDGALEWARMGTIEQQAARKAPSAQPADVLDLA
jgi:integrase